MNVYIYAADIYCEACGERIRQERALPDGATADDEWSFDSDDWPKGPYPNGGLGKADTPQHCGECGTFLGNALTRDGYEYVAELLRDYLWCGRGDVAVLRQWHDFYSSDRHPALQRVERP